jgi:hypothetical protein
MLEKPSITKLYLQSNGLYLNKAVFNICNLSIFPSDFSLHFMKKLVIT